MYSGRRDRIHLHGAGTLTTNTQTSNSVRGDTPPYRVLSVDGGGYLGLATAVFIQQIERHFSTKFCDHFDLFCGTSTGAIISAALAIGKTGDEIVSLYKDLGSKIFATKKSRGFFRSLYAIDNLKECLQPYFLNMRLGDLATNNRRILITAFNRTSGTPRVFKTDHSKRLSTDNELLLLDVVLASASAPTYFSSVTIENPSTGLTDVFCDGGVACNHPALLGFTEAAYELKNPPSAIRLLSLSTPRQSLAEGLDASTRRDYGKWQWKNSLHNILIDSNSSLVHESLRRIIDVFGNKRPLYVRVGLQNDSGIKIDDVSETATKSLVGIGSRAAIDQEIRTDIGAIIQS